MKISLVATVIGFSLLAGGCSNGDASGGSDAPMTVSTPASVCLEPGAYARAFDQARAELRDLGFILDRVDGLAGVITTLPKGTGGLATPWDREQSEFGDRTEDALERHRRIVRIEFFPAGSGPAWMEGRDLRTETGPIEMQVSVTVYNLHQPGWRINTQAILHSTYTHDPQLDERGMSSYGVAVRQDDALARRIVGLVVAHAGDQRAGG